MERQELALSAEMVGTPASLPPYCVRHGRLAFRRRDFALQSRAQPQGSRFMSANALGIAGRLGEKARKMQVVDVRDWPLCDRCVWKRRILFTLTQIVFWLALVLILGAFMAAAIMNRQSAVLGGFAVLGFALLLSSAFVFSAASVPRLVQARASEDGTSVIIKRPHQEFVDAVSPRDSCPKTL